MVPTDSNVDKTNANDTSTAQLEDSDGVERGKLVTSPLMVRDAISKNLKIELPAAVILAAGYNTIYTYPAGSGYLHGFNLEFNNTSIIARLKIDGVTVFDLKTLNQYNALAATSNNTARYQAGGGLVLNSSTIDFSFKRPIRFESSVLIEADPNGGVLLSRNFNQGIVYITKDT